MAQQYFPFQAATAFLNVQTHFAHELQLFDKVNINKKKFIITALPIWGFSCSPFMHPTHISKQGKLCAGGISQVQSFHVLCFTFLLSLSLQFDRQQPSLCGLRPCSYSKLFFSAYLQVTLSAQIPLIFIILGTLSVLNSYLKFYSLSVSRDFFKVVLYTSFIM